MKEAKKQNNQRSFNSSLLKYFDILYIISAYSLFLNSIWYFIRLLVFDRSIEISMVEIEHSFEFLFLISSLIALFRYYRRKIKVNITSYLLRFLFIIYATIGIFMTINKTYIDISPAVKEKWESGEWTF